MADYVRFLPSFLMVPEKISFWMRFSGAQRTEHDGCRCRQSLRVKCVVGSAADSPRRDCCRRLPGVTARSLIGAPHIETAYRAGEQLLKRVQAITMSVYQYVGDGVLRAQIY